MSILLLLVSYVKPNAATETEDSLEEEDGGVLVLALADGGTDDDDKEVDVEGGEALGILG